VTDIDRVELLRGSALFDELDDDALARVAGSVTEYDCPADTVLIQDGVPASGVFLVCEGTVAVETHDGGRHEVGAGESVGELAILAGTARTGRVWAQTPVRALAIERSRFERLLVDEPTVARSMLRVLARRLVGAQAVRH
jgi:CRP/FNR family transcriptional regulator